MEAIKLKLMAYVMCMCTQIAFNLINLLQYNVACIYPLIYTAYTLGATIFIMIHIHIVNMRSQ